MPRYLINVILKLCRGIEYCCIDSDSIGTFLWDGQDLSCWGSIIDNVKGREIDGNGKILTLDPSIVVASIATGLNHVMILTERREIYSMGSNISGQLGLGSTSKPIWDFRLVPDSVNLDAISIAAGNQHSVVLSSSGTVYGCGACKEYQLNIPDELFQKHGHISTFTKTLFSYIKKIGCGYWSTFALSTNGNLYTVGFDEVDMMKGNSKKYYNNETAFQKTKKEVIFEDDSKCKLKVLDFACHGDIYISLLQDGSIFTGGFYSESLGRTKLEQKFNMRKRFWLEGNNGEKINCVKVMASKFVLSAIGEDGRYYSTFIHPNTSQRIFKFHAFPDLLFGERVLKIVSNGMTSVVTFSLAKKGRVLQFVDREVVGRGFRLVDTSTEYKEIEDISVSLFEEHWSSTKI